MTNEEARIKLIEIKAQLEVILSIYGLDISDVFDLAIKALEPKFIAKSDGTIEQILSKTEETEENGIKYLNINVSDNEVKRNPDIVRLCSNAGNIEYVKVKSARDSIHVPDFNNCKWIFDFNDEVKRTISINTAALVTLADRIDILERKLAEYERNTRKPH